MVPPVSVMIPSSQSCHWAASTWSRCWSRWCSSSGNLLLPTALSAGYQNGAEVDREGEQKPKGVASTVVGGELRGQHQAPGQQGDGAAGSTGDVDCGIDIVLGHRETV